MNATDKPVRILLSDEFKRQFKRLAKKYASLRDDMMNLKESLMKNPTQGTDLGNGVRKVCMAIASKGKGKSGGARVLTMSLCVAWDETAHDLVLLTLYDKSEISNVSDRYIKSLLRSSGSL